MVKKGFVVRIVGRSSPLAAGADGKVQLVEGKFYLAEEDVVEVMKEAMKQMPVGTEVISCSMEMFVMIGKEEGDGTDVV